MVFIAPTHMQRERGTEIETVYVYLCFVYKRLFELYINITSYRLYVASELDFAVCSMNGIAHCSFNVCILFFSFQFIEYSVRYTCIFSYEACIDRYDQHFYGNKHFIGILPYKTLIFPTGKHTNLIQRSQVLMKSDNLKNFTQKLNVLPSSIHNV